MNRFDAEARNLLRTVLLFRLAVVASILVAGLLVLGGAADRSLLHPWILLLVATAVFTAASWAALRMEHASQALITAQLVADVAVASGVVYFGGGVTSPFTFLYVLCVLSGLALRSGWGAIIMGSAASIAYGALAVMQCAGALRPLAPTYLVFDVGPGASLSLHVLLQIGFFHLAAAIAASIAERSRASGDELEAKDQALREARVNTDAIIQSMRSGLVTVDLDGRVVLVNRAAELILGFEPGELEGHDFGVLVTERCPEFAVSLDAAVHRGVNTHRLDCVVRHPEGDPCPIGASLSTLYAADGERRGVVAIFQDLSEVKRMEDRMRQSDRLAAVGELAGAIAHEIRNPLTTISGSVEMLAADLEVGGEHRRLLELITREAMHLKQITNDFLAYGRLKPKQVGPTDVGKLLREVCYVVRQQDSFHEGITLDLQLPEGGIWALWDGEQIRQALVNIGLNAVQAMPKGGSLQVRVAVVPWEHAGGEGGATGRLPRAVRLSFEDTGPGIPADLLPQIFDPFFTTKREGTGLGLAIVARIIEDHGGLIDLRSHENEGTRCTITLPGVSGEEGLPIPETQVLGETLVLQS